MVRLCITALEKGQHSKNQKLRFYWLIIQAKTKQKKTTEKNDQKDDNNTLARTGTYNNLNDDRFKKSYSKYSITISHKKKARLRKMKKASRYR